MFGLRRRQLFASGTGLLLVGPPSGGRSADAVQESSGFLPRKLQVRNFAWRSVVTKNSVTP